MHQWGEPEKAVEACTDGSASDPQPLYRRASWAVVYMDEKGTVIGEEAGRVGMRESPEQTVYAGELMAVIQVRQRVRGPLEIVSDCQSVINGMHKESGVSLWRYDGEACQWLALEPV
eukprot:5233528-Amphidinium_carterae.4